jgi:hypothetical protein
MHSSCCVLQVVYFTSMFPYLVLTIFFIKGLSLKGASAGLIHMYTPKVSKIYTVNLLSSGLPQHQLHWTLNLDLRGSVYEISCREGMGLRIMHCYVNVYQKNSYSLYRSCCLTLTQTAISMWINHTLEMIQWHMRMTSIAKDKQNLYIK